MAKPKNYHHPMPAFKIDRGRLYAKLGALGGMADHANTKIRPEWSWQGNLNLNVGTRPEYSAGYKFEVKVNRSSGTLFKSKHRIHVRCPKCHAWQPFGKLHQHILSKRCLVAAEIINRLPSVPSLRSAES